MLELQTEPAASPAPGSPVAELFGLRIDAVSLESAVTRLSSWMRQASRPCRYVVTPNVDHLVILEHHEALREAYRDASMVVADGWPLVAVARWVNRPLPQRVAGSDLVPALLAAASSQTPLRVFLLGAMPGVAQRAARRIEAQWPDVRVSGTCSPPLGFERDRGENQAILRHIAQAQPDLLIVGLGAPKQELWVHAHRDQIHASVAVCAGATIDFLAGEKRRAPRWIQRMGLEWCHRMLSDPRRLIRRYARDAWVFPQIACREIMRRAK